MAPRRATPFRCAALLILCVTAVGCAGAQADPAPTATVAPPPESPIVLQPATDCATATTPTLQTGAPQGVRASTTTDDTGTSLLLKNTGQLALVVLPGPGSRLTTAPQFNPDDLASRQALEAVAKTLIVSAVPGLPAGVPWDNAFVVPQGWAVCALTDRLSTRAGIQFFGDKSSTAKYALLKQLGDDVVGRVTPAPLLKQQTFVACAKGVDKALKGTPGLNGFDLYASTVRTGTACQSSYSALLGVEHDPRAVRQTESRLFSLFKKSPALLENTRLVSALVR